MRSRSLFALALLVPCTAFGQTSSAEGIAAVARGDFAAAVRILRPLAEHAAEPDPLAAFVLASLYHSGRGVARNTDRACALYVRSAAPANPFSVQALRLAEGIHRDHPLARELCEAASRMRWVEPPAAWFALEPHGWVRIDAAGFVVRRDGVEKRALMPLGGADWVYLPTRHTQLDVTRPVPARRHFIEFFIWMPARPSGNGEWVLVWAPFEIVGVDPVEAIEGERVLATSTAGRPPTDIDVDDLRTLRVTADGDIEWVKGGPYPRGGVVPVRDAR